MAEEERHFRLRIPEALKREIEEAAVANKRSINAEIVARLHIARALPPLEEQLHALEAEMRARLAVLERLVDSKNSYRTGD